MRKIENPLQVIQKLCPDLNLDQLDKNQVILIGGRQGATGKTTLRLALTQLGYNAREMWEDERGVFDEKHSVWGYEFPEEGNRVYTYIILNRPISEDVC